MWPVAVFLTWRPIPWRRLAQLACDVLGALAVVHDAGVVLNLDALSSLRRFGELAPGLFPVALQRRVVDTSLT